MVILANQNEGLVQGYTNKRDKIYEALGHIYLFYYLC